MKKAILIILCISFLLQSKATHYMGGEITWECLPNGNYRFIMKIYRECYTIGGSDAATFGNTETLHTTVPGLLTISMTRISLTDISPQCNPDTIFAPKIFCPGMSNGSGNIGAIQENMYTSDVSYPNGITLNGIPPTEGWAFYHTSCCRNPMTNITNGTSMSWALRAIMYSYNGQNANPCFDNSPVFAELPQTVVCAGYPQSLNHNAFDIDMDSLSFEWAQPLGSIGNPILTYASGFSFNSPFPGTYHNSNNITASVNSLTGEITYESHTQGAFITVTKATSYRCGIKIAEVFREIQIVIVSCDQNTKPYIEPPFFDSITGTYAFFTDTVIAGDLVTFSLMAFDNEFMSDGTTPQTISVFATSSQFGTAFTDTASGCLYPPCATLNPPPPLFNNDSVGISFSWQTTCDHVNTPNSCYFQPKTYYFSFRFSDDYCPVPGINDIVVSIVVMPNCTINPPILKCIETHVDGKTTIFWEPPYDPDTVFYSYQIYYSANQNGPFTVIDSIYNYPVNQYTHQFSNANIDIGYYFLKTGAQHNGKIESAVSDTINNLLLSQSTNTSNHIVIQWNEFISPPPPSSFIYQIYKDDGTGSYILIDSTNQTTYTDSVPNPGENSYYIFVEDSGYCFSISNINTVSYINIESFAKDVLVFPNPFHRNIHICHNLSDIYCVDIYDITGKLKHSENLSNSHNCTEIDLSQLPSGMYFLMFKGIDSSYQKIIKL